MKVPAHSYVFSQILHVENGMAFTGRRLDAQLREMGIHQDVKPNIEVVVIRPGTKLGDSAPCPSSSCDGTVYWKKY